MDNLTKDQRKKNMQAIKATDTSIECILRKALWRKGYRYRKNYARIEGKPDIVLTKYRIAIFCDGEFFHGKDWAELEKRILNGNNSSYWYGKIRRNIERDKEVNTKLHGEGWTVLRFWGKDIKYNLDQCLKVIDEAVMDALLD
ncbi:very short patch repair endonuclease [Butyrivibrio sp. NC2002]|uniref:very short patch repair endonuclease n=1 Tax=Butyrivibrio sp. NC2002 TaxID=1410610 RepID=UPI00056C3C23|nr:very short patch repair endonuclease [Butyrivibrio sp. NC2002]